MSTQHTQGRIRVSGIRLYADDYPGIDCLATMQVSNQPMWEQDARRLVACWNACDGVPTELLETYPAPPAPQQIGQGEPDEMPTSAAERHLRLLLAVRVGMQNTYFEEGEAHGAEHGISIDFMREPVVHIDAKLRALNTARAECAPKPQPLTDEQSRELAEQHYVCSPWYDTNPASVIGSRQWCAYWDGWQAAHNIGEKK